MRILLDFDGVLYPGGQCVDAEDLALAPIPKSIAWLKSLLAEHDVLLFTARLCQTRAYSPLHVAEPQPVARKIETWLRRNGLTQAEVCKLHIVMPWEGKPPADLYIDDHGKRHVGLYEPLTDADFVPWWNVSNN